MTDSRALIRHTFWSHEFRAAWRKVCPMEAAAGSALTANFKLKEHSSSDRPSGSARAWGRPTNGHVRGQGPNVALIPSRGERHLTLERNCATPCRNGNLDGHSLRVGATFALPAALKLTRSAEAAT